MNIKKFNKKYDNGEQILESIDRNGIIYEFCEIKESGNFFYDWNKYCQIEPDREWSFENVQGEYYVIYSKGDKIISEFNIDE